MKKDIKYTKAFKKQFKKRKVDSKWNSIFKDNLPKNIDDQERTPWNFIIQCLIDDKKFPSYFYPHHLEGLKDIKKQINRQLAEPDISITILELHFDCHSGNHLLVYVTNVEKVFLIGIGTHSELFK